MKKLLPFLSIALMMAACNSAPKQSEENIWKQQAATSAPDTTGLASFQAWKVQNELASMQQSASTETVAPAARPRVITKYVAAPVRKSTKSASSNTNSSSSPTSSGSGEVNNDNGTMTSESGNTAKAEEKKGWSKAAKGAVIGGVAGAVGGAVVNKKNRVVGAVIGAVIGAGGGYAIGRGMDKKDGRIEMNQFGIQK